MAGHKWPPGPYFGHFELEIIKQHSVWTKKTLKFFISLFSVDKRRARCPSIFPLSLNADQKFKCQIQPFPATVVAGKSRVASYQGRSIAYWFFWRHMDHIHVELDSRRDCIFNFFFVFVLQETKSLVSLYHCHGLSRGCRLLTRRAVPRVPLICSSFVN